MKKFRKINDMPTKVTRMQLPKRLRHLFWEYDFGRLSWDKNRDLVMLKVLSAGGLSDWKWLRRQVSAKELRAWLIERWGRGLSPRQLVFWGVILNIPTRTVMSWLRMPERTVWDRR